MVPTYISPLPTRAPRGYMSDPSNTLDHAGQARNFEPNFQQWQAQVQHQQQAQVQQHQWGPQAQQWGQQMQHPTWGASTGTHQWGPQCRPQQVQASPTQDRRGLASEEPSQAQHLRGGLSTAGAWLDNNSCPQRVSQAVLSPGQRFPAFAGQTAF